MALIYRQVTATYVDANGNPRKGYVEFTPSTYLVLTGEGLVPNETVQAWLDDEGKISISLLCNNSTGVSPSGWKWIIEEKIPNGNTGYLDVPDGVGALDITYSLIAGTDPPYYGIQGPAALPADNGSYAIDLGAVSAGVPITVTHNLATYDVVVDVHRKEVAGPNASTSDLVDVDIETLTANTIRLTFADNAVANVYRVVVLSAGGNRAIASFNGVFNVKDYGALGNGVADDTTAIQLAIDTASAAGGGSVYLPTGVFRISNNLIISSGASVNIYGNGMNLTKIVTDTPLGIEFNAKGNIKGIWIEGQKTNTSILCSAISFNGTIGAPLTDISVTDCKFTNINGGVISLNHTTRTLIHGCVVDQANGSAVRMNLNNHYTYITNNSFVDCQLAGGDGNGTIQHQYEGAGGYTHGYIDSNYIKGSKVGIGADGLTEHYTISNNHIRNCTGEGIALSGHNLNIHGNLIRDCVASGILYFVYSLTNSKGVVNIVNNIVRGCGQGTSLVIAVEGGTLKDINIASNFFYENYAGIQTYTENSPTTYFIDNVNVIGNTLTDNTNDILLMNGTDGSLVNSADNFYKILGDITPIIDGGTAHRKGTIFEDTTSYVTPNRVDQAGTYWLQHSHWNPISANSYERKIGQWIGFGQNTNRQGMGLQVHAWGPYSNETVGYLQAANTIVAATLMTIQVDYLNVPKLAFFGASPVAKPTGVAVDAASIHAALVSLGLISA